MNKLMQRLSWLINPSAATRSIPVTGTDSHAQEEDNAQIQRKSQTIDLSIEPGDPLIEFFLASPGAVEIDEINIQSPALEQMRANGVKMIVPLVSQGELIGLLNLGARLSEQGYSSDDRTLLNSLAAQAAPAARVAQLVRQQQEEAQERERLEQQLRVARIIQKTLLPEHVPALPGWKIAAYYQPAQAVGGDFYDFLYFEDGKLGIVIGDVSDKGVPAALVMATTRSIIRAVTQQISAPREVLKRVNEMLHPDIAMNMFVTCLYALLDPATGYIRYANAGHCLPMLRNGQGVRELRATGMPLGLLPGMDYEEKETTLEKGDSLVLYSDGLVEAHSPAYELFSFDRLGAEVARYPRETDMISYLLSGLDAFTGEGWLQEDDVTILTVDFEGSAEETDKSNSPALGADTNGAEGAMINGDWMLLSEFSLPSEPGNERLAMRRAAEVFIRTALSGDQVERLKTAVAEAAMNAMEHGNGYRSDLPAVIRILASPDAVAVRITDQGGGRPIGEPETPDLEAKLEGLQSPRGWGLFLIRNMVDEMNLISDSAHHTIELIMHLEGAGDA